MAAHLQASGAQGELVGCASVMLQSLGGGEASVALGVAHRATEACHALHSNPCVSCQLWNLR